MTETTFDNADWFPSRHQPLTWSEACLSPVVDRLMLVLIRSLHGVEHAYSPP